VTTLDGESDDLGGGPPTVLLAALGAALLIAVGLIAGFASLGGDDSTDAAPERRAAATTTTADDRVLLTVSVDGDGFGRVEIEPSDVACSASCEYKFTAGRRVVATVEPLPGSTFEGWADACSGDGRCSFVMDRPRNLRATFAEEPVSDALCDDARPAEEQDPSCAADDLADPDAPPPPPPDPGPDCFDNVDNDDDGLTDTAQDPDCDASGSEAGTDVPPGSPTSPPPPAALPNQCTDGEDNDNDGLTDRAQDPDCEKGRSESG